MIRVIMIVCIKGVAMEILRIGFWLYLTILLQEFQQIWYECESRKIWNEAKSFVSAAGRMGHPFKWELEKTQ